MYSFYFLPQNWFVLPTSVTHISYMRFFRIASSNKPLETHHASLFLFRQSICSNRPHYQAPLSSPFHTTENIPPIVSGKVKTHHSTTPWPFLRILAKFSHSVCYVSLTCCSFTHWLTHSVFGTCIRRTAAFPATCLRRDALQPEILFVFPPHRVVLIKQ